MFGFGKSAQQKEYEHMLRTYASSCSGMTDDQLYKEYDRSLAEYKKEQEELARQQFYYGNRPDANAATYPQFVKVNRVKDRHDSLCSLMVGRGLLKKRKNR